jgi:hypothetical protein
MSNCGKSFRSGSRLEAALALARVGFAERSQIQLFAQALAQVFFCS